MRCSKFLRLASVFSWALACFVGSPLQAKVKWDPVPKEVLAATQSESFPGVAAEDLIRTTAMDGDSTSTWFDYYIRRKIYNPKAAQEEGVFQIYYDSEHSVIDISARLTKKNGETLLFSKKDFTDAEVYRTKDYKQKVKAIAVPNLEAGDVIEYQWKQETDDTMYRPIREWVQGYFPTKYYKFSLISSKRDSTVIWFNVKNPETKSEGSVRTLTVRDIPPFTFEPNMPPEGDVRGMLAVAAIGRWAHIWGKDSFWHDLGAAYGEQFRLEVKPDDAIKAAAKEAIAGATTDEEKLTKLYDLARTKITNLDYYDSAEAQAARKYYESLEDNPTAAQIWKKEYGYSAYVSRVFASLCIAAGYETYWQWNSSKTVTTQVNIPNGYLFMNDTVIVVKRGNNLSFFAPGDLWMKPGMVSERFEGAAGFLVEEDSKEVHFGKPGVAPAAASQLKRQAAMELSEEGDLSGTVTLSYTGHLAAQKKKKWAGKSEAEIERLEREELTKDLPAAEMSDFAFVNQHGPWEPTSMTFKLRIPGYAENAGERLVLVPSLFEKHAEPEFKSNERVWPIAFPFAWNGLDDISIKIPASMELDAPSAPQGFGKPDEPIRVRYKVGFSKKEHKIAYKREFVVGDFGMTSFPLEMYPAIKQRFDTLLKADTHTLLLKPKADPAPQPSADGAPKS